MREVFPSEKRLFSKYYKYYRNMVNQGQRVEFIVEFVQYLSKYNKEISLQDEGLFSEEDTYYPSKPIQLMKGIDFKRIWRLETLTEGSKTSIWKYLQTLYLIGTYVLKETNKYQEFVKKQQSIVDGLVQNLKYEKQIKQEAEKLERKKAQEDTSGQGILGALGGLGGLGDLFDENNIITQIAKEIVKDLNLMGGVGDPIQTINMLFSQDGSKFKEILTRVGSKITSMAQEKGLTEEQLMEQAKQMSEKLMKMFKGIPGVEKITQEIVSNLTHVNATGTAQGAPNATEVKEQLEKCQATIQQLTSDLKQGMSQMGLENFDEFQKNIQSMISHATDAPNPTGQGQDHSDKK